MPLCQLLRTRRGGNGIAQGHRLLAVTPQLDLEVRMLREMLAREQETVTDLRARLDAEAAERRRLTALLTHQGEKSDPAPVRASPSRRWFWWGRRKA